MFEFYSIHKKPFISIPFVSGVYYVLRLLFLLFEVVSEAEQEDRENTYIEKTTYSDGRTETRTVKGGGATMLIIPLVLIGIVGTNMLDFVEKSILYLIKSHWVLLMPLFVLGTLAQLDAKRMDVIFNRLSEEDAREEKSFYISLILFAISLVTSIICLNTGLFYENMDFTAWMLLTIPAVLLIHYGYVYPLFCALFLSFVYYFYEREERSLLWDPMNIPLVSSALLSLQWLALSGSETGVQVSDKLAVASSFIIPVVSYASLALYAIGLPMIIIYLLRGWFLERPVFNSKVDGSVLIFWGGVLGALPILLCINSSWWLSLLSSLSLVSGYQSTMWQSFVALFYAGGSAIAIYYWCYKCEIAPLKKAFCSSVTLLVFFMFWQSLTLLPETVVHSQEVNRVSIQGNLTEQADGPVQVNMGIALFGTLFVIVSIILPAVSCYLQYRIATDDFDFSSRLEVLSNYQKSFISFTLVLPLIIAWLFLGKTVGLGIDAAALEEVILTLFKINIFVYVVALAGLTFLWFDEEYETWTLKLLSVFYCFVILMAYFFASFLMLMSIT